VQALHGSRYCIPSTRFISNVPDDSGIEEERVGGGQGPTGGGPEQEDRAWIRADEVYPECWRSTHLSDAGGDTPRASGHCMCDLHMYRSTARKWY
jgi:hypothetical protein